VQAACESKLIRTQLAMKTLIQSRLAAIAASLAAAVVAWFVGRDLIGTEQAAQATGELRVLLDAFLAAAAALIAWAVAHVIRKVTGGNSGGGDDQGTGGGGIPGIVLMGTATAVLLGGFTLSSCTPLSGALLGGPIPAAEVRRANEPDSAGVWIAEADLRQAQASAEAQAARGEPPAVHGLYDAGAAAQMVRDVFAGASK